MTKRMTAKSLVKSVLNGDWTFDSALEEHLDGVGPLRDVYRYLAYANMGWHDRVLDVEDGTVGQFIKDYNLEHFLPLLNRSEKARFRLGDVVTFQDANYRVIRRREVWPFAAPRFDDWELLIEQIAGDGDRCHFVGEGEVQPVGEAVENES